MLLHVTWIWRNYVTHDIGFEEIPVTRDIDLLNAVGPDMNLKKMQLHVIWLEETVLHWHHFVEMLLYTKLNMLKYYNTWNDVLDMLLYTIWLCKISVILDIHL